VDAVTRGAELTPEARERAYAEAQDDN